MTSRPHQLTALLLSLAVFAVSTTCTTAGCLLQAAMDSKATGAPHACCPHLPSAHQQAPRSNDCPLCRNSLITLKAVEQSKPRLVQPLLDASWLNFIFTPQSFLPADLSHLAPGRPDAIPLDMTPLSRHCALLF